MERTVGPGKRNVEIRVVWDLDSLRGRKRQEGSFGWEEKVRGEFRVRGQDVSRDRRLLWHRESVFKVKESRECSHLRSQGIRILSIEVTLLLSKPLGLITG